MNFVQSIFRSKTHIVEQFLGRIAWLKALKAIKAIGCAFLISGAGGLGANAQYTNSTFVRIPSYAVQRLPTPESKFNFTWDMPPSTRLSFTYRSAEEEFKRRIKGNNWEEILSFIQENQTAVLSNPFKIQIIKSLIQSFKEEPSILILAIEALDPVFSDFEFIDLLRHADNNSFKIVFHVHKSICDRYCPTNPLKTLQSLSELNSVFNQDNLFEFISAHCRPIINSLKFFRFLPMNFGLDFYKNLHRIGWESRWFNTPDRDGKTLIHRLVRDGELRFLKKLGRDISIDEIYLRDHFFKEEIRDCFAQKSSISASEIKPGSMIAQDGCRMIVLEEAGRVQSFPGHEARIVFQNMTGIIQTKPSFTVFLNSGHASIDFGNGLHVGFTPYEFAFTFKKGANKAVSAACKTAAGEHPMEKKLFLDFGNKGKAYYFYNIFSSGHPAFCQISDDHSERELSDRSNQLKLDFYATESQVAAIRAYAEQTKSDCQSGTETYDLFRRNCIDFINRAIAASGIKANFLDAFSRMELVVRRPGLATIKGAFESHGPERRSTDIPISAAEKIVEKAFQPNVLASVSAVILYSLDPRLRKIIRITLQLLCLPFKGCMAVYNRLLA